MPKRPPLLDQRVQGRDSSVLCGETCDAMIAQACGLAYAPEDVADWMRNHSGEGAVSGGTSTALNVAWLQAHGLSVDEGTNYPADDAYAAGRYTHMLVHDNRNADPDVRGPFNHYIVGYARNPDGSTACSNPWGGRDMAYGDGQLRPALEYIFSVWNPNAPAPIPVEDQPMTPGERARIDSLESAIAQMFWVEGMGGRIDQASYDGFMNAVKTFGAGETVNRSFNNPLSVDYVDTAGGLVRAAQAAKVKPS